MSPRFSIESLYCFKDETGVFVTFDPVTEKYSPTTLDKLKIWDYWYENVAAVLINEVYEYNFTIYELSPKERKKVDRMPSEILQFVEAGSTRIGQKVKLPKGKAWWNVEKRDSNYTVIQRGKSIKRISKHSRLLQEFFENLTTY